MLVLTRKVGEAIMIGDDIVIRVMGINGGSMRVGIEAPRDIRVDREEIRERINAEKRANDKA